MKNVSASDTDNQQLTPDSQQPKTTMLVPLTEIPTNQQAALSNQYPTGKIKPPTDTPDNQNHQATSNAVNN
jgi:hypothetical protein